LCLAASPARFFYSASLPGMRGYSSLRYEYDTNTSPAELILLEKNTPGHVRSKARNNSPNFFNAESSVPGLANIHPEERGKGENRQERESMGSHKNIIEH